MSIQHELQFLGSNSQISAMMRATDWSKSPLGAPETWPQSLRSVVDLMLGSEFPMFVAWGPDLGFLYNDAYAQVLGEKHPRALGAKFYDIWSEIWSDISPLIDAALQGVASYREDLPLLMNRKGYDEQTWFTFSYSPVRDESGQIAGMFCTCSETTGKVLAETRLRTAAQRQQRLFQAAPGFITILNGPEHVFEFVNNAYARLFGTRTYEGRPVRSVFPELEGQGFFELLDQVYTTGERFVAKRVSVRLESIELFLDFIYEPIIDENGQVTGIFCEGHDVTDTHLAELEIQENAARLRALADNLPSGMVYQISTGADGAERRFLYVSQSHEKLTGVPAAAVLADPSIPYNLVVPEHRAVLAEAEAASLAERKPFDVQVQFRRADGQVRWSRIISAPREQADGSLIWDGIQIDITEQKTAETLLRGLNQELEQRVSERTAERDRTWQLSHDLLAVADFEGQLKSINPAWTRVLGFEQETLLARPFAELIHPDDLAAAGEIMAQMRRGQRTEHFEDRLRTSRGDYRTISWTAVPEQDVFYAIGRDVTDRYQMEEQLRQSQKMEAVGQLTGGLAHDFNNILAGIGGSLEMMQNRLAQGRVGELERYMTAASGAVRRASGLTQRLLAFSRRQTLDPRPTNLNLLTSGMLELINRSVGPEIHVETVGATGLWSTFVDAGQLENALLNLCINARDAMPNGGKLTIETGNRWMDDRAARERGLEPGQYVSICVSDTGTGMTPDVMARAFDPFYTTKPIGQGTGLGLSMAYGFAGQSGGRVRIYSGVGQGTRVCIYLPRYLGSAEAEAAQLGADTAPRSENHETVLLVDDEPLVRMIAAEQLEELGYRVIEAGDAVEATALLRQGGQLALLVTDVGLPGGMNGRQLAEAARQLQPGLPVLFITGYAENAVLNHGHLDHGMHVLTKPFTMEALAKKVKELIST